MSLRLGYVVRFVGDLDAAIEFYAGILGLPLGKRTDHWAQFTCGSVTLGLYQRGEMARHLEVEPRELGEAPGAGEIAFETDDVDAAWRTAVAAGARGVRPPADRPWGERTAYLADPDGGLVELYHRPGPAPARP